MRTFLQNAMLAAMLASAATVAPADSRRDRDQIVAGALILGLMGMALSERAQGGPRGGIRALRAYRDPALRVPAVRGLGAPSLQSATRLYLDPFSGQITSYDPYATTNQRPPAPGQGAARPFKPDTPPQNGSRIYPLFEMAAAAAPQNVAQPVVIPAPTQTVSAPVTVQPLPPASAPGDTGLVVPAHCLATFDQGGDNLALYSPECLASATSFAADLPITCAVTVRTLGRFVSGYDPQCLATAGYTLAGTSGP